MAHRLSISALLMSIVLVGCGDDGEGGARSLTEYCRLGEELDSLAQDVFADLESGTQAEFNAAFADLVAEHEDDLDRLEEVAPAEISDDVATLNRITREAVAADDLSTLESGEGAEVDDRIQEFESENCPSTD